MCRWSKNDKYGVEGCDKKEMLLLGCFFVFCFVHWFICLAGVDFRFLKTTLCRVVSVFHIKIIETNLIVAVTNEKILVC